MDRVYKLYQFNAVVIENDGCIRIDKRMEFDLLLDGYTTFEDLEHFYKRLGIMYDIAVKGCDDAYVTLRTRIEWVDGSVEENKWETAYVNEYGIGLRNVKTTKSGEGVDITITKVGNRIHIEE